MSEPAQTELTRPRVQCPSVIVAVVVHSRGAVVTRRVETPGELPTGPFDLAIGGITPMMDPGSVRASIPDDGRRLVSIDSRIRVPTLDEGPGLSVQKLEELNVLIERLTARQGSLDARANRLRQFVALPAGKKALQEEGPAERAAAALSLNQVASEALAAVENRIVGLRAELSRLQREQTRLGLDDAQKSSAERMGSSHPTRELVLHIAEGDGSSLEYVEVSYAVPYAAQWWPMYTLRLTERGKQASLAMEALVAQRTGEDWTDARIGLATSEIAFDASLPRLPSLRLGKRQVESRSGFREPPGGTESLFDGYDAFRGRPAPKSQTQENVAVGSRTVREAAPADVMNYQSGAVPSAPPPAPSAAPMSFMLEDGERLEAASMPMARKRASPVQASASIMSAGMSAVDARFGAVGGGGGAAPPPPPEPSFEPGDEWLEFESLELGGPESSARGRLRRRASQWQPPSSELFDAQQSARRLRLVNPAVSRGMFDYRYDAEGTARVPADGRLHRFELRNGRAESRLIWRTTPVADPQVYREAEFVNPFDSPLLAGPIDVFSEGQLVTTTHVERVDAGGAMRVGLGVDERIRVARNVRMQEESAGLLRGKRELTHDVEIELRSGLGEEARVEVYDRIPVSEDETVTVELVQANPSPETYEQLEREAPVKGGKRWTLKLPAGGSRTIAYRYEVTLRAKDEIVGGNRRE